MKCLGLHNKPTAEVHPGHMLTGSKEEEEEPSELPCIQHFFNRVSTKKKKKYSKH
jgi:hypothetical protein